MAGDATLTEAQLDAWGLLGAEWLPTSAPPWDRDNHLDALTKDEREYVNEATEALPLLVAEVRRLRASASPAPAPEATREEEVRLTRDMIAVARECFQRASPRSSAAPEPAAPHDPANGPCPDCEHTAPEPDCHCCATHEVMPEPAAPQETRDGDPPCTIGPCPGSCSDAEWARAQRFEDHPEPGDGCPRAAGERPADDAREGAMRWVRIGEDMIWPLPCGEIEWALRYAQTLTTRERLAAASILAAYAQFVSNTQAMNARVQSFIRRAMRGEEPTIPPASREEGRAASDPATPEGDKR